MISRAGEDMEQTKGPLTIGWNVNWYTALDDSFEMLINSI